MRITASATALLAILLWSAAPDARQGTSQQPQPPAGSTSPAQDQQPERAQQPPIRTGINFVRVDVIVTDKQGRPVLDLKPEEFTVTEDGKNQQIDTFTVVKVDEASQVGSEPLREIRSEFDEEREAARPDVRLFVILLDDYHVRRGNDMAVRKPLIEFIQNQLAPADMVALMYPLTPVTDLRFSRNRESLIGAIERFEGRKFNYEPRNEFEERYAYYPASTVERIRNDVTIGALKGAAVKMAGLREGRKSIIFVSEGFTSTLPAQLNDPVAAMPGIGNPASNRPGADVVNESVEFFNEASMMGDLKDVFDVANRNNTSIYAVDPRGLAAFEYDINEGVGSTVDRRHLGTSLDTLRALADNTDGRAIVSRNDLAAGMKQIVRDSSGYYLLGYNSTEAPTDGKFHEIKVRVTRRGLDVRARKGYWAYTAEDAARATAPPKPETPSAIRNALNAVAEPARGRSARFWLGTARGENGRTQVTFVWEPIAPGPGERRSDDDQPVRVGLTATAPDGRPLFRGRVPGETPPAGSPDGGGGSAQAGTASGASATFDAPPGQVQLRMTVEGSRGQVVDSAIREITLPDFTAVAVSFSTPRVYRGRSARDIQNAKTNLDALPTADRAFSRTERLLVRADAYAPGGTAPAVSARLLNRAGDPMSELPVQLNGSRADLELTLSGLAAGDYLIELNAKTSTGSAQELIAFRVGR